MQAVTSWQSQYRTRGNKLIGPIQCLQLAFVSILLFGSKQIQYKSLSQNKQTNDFLARPQDQVRLIVRESTSTTKQDAETVVVQNKRREKKTKLTRFCKFSRVPQQDHHQAVWRQLALRLLCPRRDNLHPWNCSRQHVRISFPTMLIKKQPPIMRQTCR